MTATRAALIEQARAQYGEIAPCAGRTIEQCFNGACGALTFWFNDATGNTHTVSAAEVTA